MEELKRDGKKIANNIGDSTIIHQVGDKTVDYAIVQPIDFKKVKEESKEETTKSEKSVRGKKSRAAGQRFELKVRQELESFGWIVSKWMNTVDFDKEGKIGKLVSSKRKYNPFMKVMTIGTGFPDFICFKNIPQGTFEVIGLEVKANGYLDQIEKGMCLWLLEHKIFSRILIAKKSKTSSEIEYVDFNKRYQNNES